MKERKRPRGLRARNGARQAHQIGGLNGAREIVESVADVEELGRDPGHVIDHALARLAEMRERGRRSRDHLPPRLQHLLRPRQLSAQHPPLQRVRNGLVV